MIPDAARLVGEDFIFQQDNIIHQFTPPSTRQWVQDNKVTVSDWPAKSPDVNPIESLWHQLKIAASQQHPETEEELWKCCSWRGGGFPGYD